MSEPQNPPAPARIPVTVLGLGPMGQAMVRALLAAGHPVTVWNRTTSRADGVVADGAVLAATPADALAASELVILSLTDYQAMHDVLGAATGALGGRVLVNLSSDTPDRTREAADWADGHGASLVAGGVMVPAPMVGTEASYLYCSGPEELVERHRPVLEVLGALRHLGADVTRAQLMYQAQLDVFLTTLSSLMHATALLGSAGLTAREVFADLVGMVAATPSIIGAAGDLAAQLDAGEHPGHLSTATMMGATTDHIVAASESAGIDLALPRAVQSHYHRVIEDGRGGDNWTRIVDAIRTPLP